MLCYSSYFKFIRESQGCVISMESRQKLNFFFFFCSHLCRPILIYLTAYSRVSCYSSAQLICLFLNIGAQSVRSMHYNYCHLHGLNNSTGRKKLLTKTFQTLYNQKQGLKYWDIANIFRNGWLQVWITHTNLCKMLHYPSQHQYERNEYTRLGMFNVMRKVQRVVESQATG